MWLQVSGKVQMHENDSTHLGMPHGHVHLLVSFRYVELLPSAPSKGLDFTPRAVYRGPWQVKMARGGPAA